MGYVSHLHRLCVLGLVVDFDAMAKKTVIKQVLKYAPIKTDYIQAMNVDDTVGTELTNLELNDSIIESDYREVA